jgi:hypothetical protein
MKTRARLSGDYSVIKVKQVFYMSVSFVDNERHLYPYSGIYEGGKVFHDLGPRKGLGCQMTAALCLYVHNKLHTGSLRELLSLPSTEEK